MKLPAVYKEHPVQQFNDNPLSEAIHVCFDKQSLSTELNSVINIRDFWQLNNIYQKAVLQALRQTHIAAPIAFKLYGKFIGLILDSYSRRNPMLADSLRLKHEVAESQHKGAPHFLDSLYRAESTAASSVVTGPSGVGKTTTIRYVLSVIPQVIEHIEYKGVAFKQQQVVWLSIDLPPTPSLKALALNFFRAIDKALGIEQYENAWITKSHKSVDAHLNAMASIALNYNVGLVHIDEIQFILRYKQGKDTPSLQCLEALFNKIGIPVVLSCTTHGLALFQSPSSSSLQLEPDITTVRRMLNDREFTLVVCKRSSSHYIQLFDALFPSSLVHPDMSIDENFSDKFLFLTCGLPAIMIRLAHLFHEQVVSFVEHNIPLPLATPLLESVYKQQFSLMEPALACLRQNQATLYEHKMVELGNKGYTNSERRAEPRQKTKPDKGVLKGGMYANPSEVFENDQSPNPQKMGDVL